MNFHRQGTPELYAEFLKRQTHGEEPDELKDLSTPYGSDSLELPIAPAWFSEPPSGTLDDGIRLSLAALELKLIKERPEVFEERARQVVDVEFVY